METWTRDLRYAVRALRRSPMLTFFAVLTLALGIGANTAIFSVTRGVLLAPLPYPDASSLVRVWVESPTNEEFFLHLQERESTYDGIALYRTTTYSMAGDGNPEELRGAAVTAEHFQVVGVSPVLGRGFHPEENDPGRGGVAVVSHGLWHRRLAGDPEVIGRSVRLDGNPYTIVGVMPESYIPLDERSQIWVPIEIDPADELHADRFGYMMLARLAPGVTAQRATDDLRSALASYNEERPGYVTGLEGGTVVPWHEHLVGDVRSTFMLLFGAVGLVLLIVCANVANLLLVRIAGRRRELALRSALGAGRLRLAAQVLMESTMLSLLGGALGILVGSWTLSALIDQLPSSVPRISQIRLDEPVLIFAIVLAVVSGLVFGLAPALRAGRIDQRSALISGTRRSQTVSNQRPNHLLIAAEIALAVVLVVGAGLLVRSFQERLGVDVGFSTHRILTLNLKPPAGSYRDDAERLGYFEQVAEQAAAVAGVERVAVIDRLPMTPGDVSLSFTLPGQQVSLARSVSVRVMTPGLLETLDIPLVQGRALADSDHAEAPQVGLINQSLARQLWGEQSAVGKMLYFEEDQPWFTVVGVVADFRQHRLDQASKPQVYLPLKQASWATRMALVVRLAADVPAVLPALEEAIWSVDPRVPITDVATIDELIHRTLTDSRLLTTLFSLFGALALMLSALGVFGVTWNAVVQRTRENGIRLALGATGGDVVRTTLARALRPVAVGIVVGALAALGFTRLLGGFLFGVTPTDPLVFGTVVALLGACATLAAWLPARRATRADPIIALKAE